MATLDQMKQLNKRLSRAGFSARFLREQVLPKNWKDEMASSHSRYQQLLEFLSQHLAINLESLEDTSSQVIFDNSRTRFFKGPDVTEEADAGLHLAEGVTRIALAGMSPFIPTTVPSAAAVRRRILETGERWVGLRALISFCWNINTPVIHVQSLPPKAKRLRGVAIETGGRNAIVLCQQHLYPARHLIPLAHEMGHLAGRHMEFIGLMATTQEELRFNDRTEAEAHRYATELLTGGQSLFPDYRRFQRPQALVEAIYEQSHAKQIDPGYLIVKRASETGDWREANIALSIIEGEESAISLINSEVRKHLDTSRIPPISRAFFTSITGVTFPVRADASASSRSATNIPADVLSPTLETNLYPDSLLQSYQFLVRQGYVGELSPEQTQELAQIREEIQNISRRNERTQESARKVEDMNASLSALESQVEARIAQRVAEQREETGQTR